MTQKQKLLIANGLYYMVWGFIFLIFSPLFLPVAIIVGIMMLNEWVDDTRKQGSEINAAGHHHDRLTYPGHHRLRGHLGKMTSERNIHVRLLDVHRH